MVSHESLMRLSEANSTVNYQGKVAVIDPAIPHTPEGKPIPWILPRFGLRESLRKEGATAVVVNLGGDVWKSVTTPS